MFERTYISAVIPVFNEESNLDVLYERLTNVLGSLSKSYEIIFVDDGSADSSWQIIERMCRQDTKVRGIKFAKNFGQHVAITAGLDHAGGDMVVLMDADLQDPPEMIEEMYKKFREGFDIVCAVRENRGDPFYRGLAAKMFYVVFRKISKLDIPSESGVFRVVSRKVIEGLKECKGRHRFITGWMSWLGYSQTIVRIKRNTRHSGRTQYNFLKLLRLAIDGLVSCSSVSFESAPYFGAAIFLFGCFIGGIFLAKPASFNGMLSIAVFLLMLFFLVGGTLLIILGMVARAQAVAAQNGPAYVIEQIIGEKRINGGTTRV